MPPRATRKLSRILPDGRSCAQISMVPSPVMRGVAVSYSSLVRTVHAGGKSIVNTHTVGRCCSREIRQMCEAEQWAGLTYETIPRLCYFFWRIFYLSVRGFSLDGSRACLFVFYVYYEGSFYSYKSSFIFPPSAKIFKKISTPKLYCSYFLILMFLLIKLLNDRSMHCFISHVDRC